MFRIRISSMGCVMRRGICAESHGGGEVGFWSSVRGNEDPWLGHTSVQRKPIRFRIHARSGAGALVHILSVRIED